MRQALTLGPGAQLDVLREARSEKLKVLLKHTPSDKGYRHILATFLEADFACQDASGFTPDNASY